MIVAGSGGVRKVRGDSSEMKGVENVVMEQGIDDKERMEEKENEWNEVSPVKGGKAQMHVLQNHSSEIVISASKYSVLMDEKEEGEFLVELEKDIEDDKGEDNGGSEMDAEREETWSED
ncbi:hypothetical protein IGI04_034437 [Brassica rapa subsp. trilocularis]|uniref:Uncharacterized protein n=1 Tax=Brassica rapa subsp. trilocularis TaxID=1813537 RepID=A0ABQ7L8Q4_BRACM|nr:hypothetical protein IGI04_034437 [Brassica rapa subsp. trilocularis]